MDALCWRWQLWTAYLWTVRWRKWTWFNLWYFSFSLLQEFRLLFIFNILYYIYLKIIPGLPLLRKLSFFSFWRSFGGVLLHLIDNANNFFCLDFESVLPENFWGLSLWEWGVLLLFAHIHSSPLYPDFFLGVNIFPNCAVALGISYQNDSLA